ALAALLEHVAHAARADAHEHFHEVRTRDAEERHIGFAGDRLGEQRLAGARRSDHQDALRNPSTHFGELLRILQKLDDLGNLFLGFIATRDVREREPIAVTREQFRAALAEAERTATRLAELADEKKIEQADDDDERDHL